MKKWIYLLCLLVMVGSTTFMAGAAGENLFQNGDFEAVGPDQRPTGWEVESSQHERFLVQSVSTAHSGKNAVMIQSTEIACDTRLHQTVKVKPDTFYRFSTWIKTENVVVPEGKTGANISILGGFDSSPSLDGTRDWTYTELNFQTHPKQKEIKLCVRLGMFCSEVTGTAYFDDAKLEELTSAPASFVRLTDPNAAPVRTENTNRGGGSGGGGGSGIIWWILLFVLFVVAQIYIFRRKRQQQPESSSNS